MSQIFSDAQIAEVSFLISTSLRPCRSSRMGNLCSSGHCNRDAVVQNLWKSQRAIPVLPINPDLDSLRVLCRKSDGFHDVGTVYSLCTPGAKKEWLKHEVYSQRRSSIYRLPPKSIGQQTSVISDDEGALAKALVGSAYAAAWFTKAESIAVAVPECEVREFNMEKWEEMMKHFDPDLQTSTLRSPGCNGKHDLFVVQKVVLVSQIKITASYKHNGAPEVKTPVKPPQGVNIETSIRITSDRVVREFTLTAQKQNQKLPVALSGFSYTYDRFGVREHFGTETCAQADGEIGESSGTSQGDSESDDEDRQTDPNMGLLLEENEWFASINPMDLEIYPNVEEPSDGEEGQEAEEEEEEEEEVVDPNAPGLDDID